MGVSNTRLIRAALEIVDESGPEALTMAAVAARLGVKSPSLYKHVRGLAELRTLVGAEVLADLTERFAEATIGRSGSGAVRAGLDEYRAFALRFPHRYALVPPDPLGDPALADAGQRLLSVVAATLREYRLDDSDTVHVLRALRTVAHGFATLEIAGGFGLPEDCDHSYERLIDVILRGLHEVYRPEERTTS